jgi:hypothetical protein
MVGLLRSVLLLSVSGLSVMVFSLIVSRMFGAGLDAVVGSWVGMQDGPVL